MKETFSFKSLQTSTTKQIQNFTNLLLIQCISMFLKQAIYISIINLKLKETLLFKKLKHTYTHLTTKTGHF